MRKMSKVTIIALAAACLAFTGCGGKDSSQAVETTVTEEVASTAEETTIEPTTVAATTTPAATTEAETESQAAVEMKEVGTEEVGYLMVPAEWVDFIDLDGNSSKQYSNNTGTSIITLDIVNTEGLSEEEKSQLTAEVAASNIYHNLQLDDVYDLSAAKVTLGGYDAVQVYGFFESEDHALPSIIVCWVFQDKTGILHYIAAEGTEEEVFEVFDYVDSTYSLEIAE